MRSAVATSLLLLAMGVLCAEAQAAESTPLRVSLEPMCPRPRTGAPIALELTLDSGYDHLLEGRMRFVLLDGLAAIGRYVSGEMAVINGRQRYRLTLPPPTRESIGRWVDVRMQFAGEVEIDLAPTTLATPGGANRSFVVGVCRGDAAGGGWVAEVPRNMLLMDLDPRPVDERDYTCSIATVVADKMPAGPLGCCAFDILVLAGEGFGELSSGQLDAVLRWVRGGGSVLVFPRENEDQRHLEFLNALAGTATHFGSAASGPLSVGARPQRGEFFLVDCGLGRAALAAGPVPRFDFDSAEWRETVAFLWRLNRAQARLVVSEGKWKKPEPVPTGVGYDPYRGGVRREPLAVGLDVMPLQNGSLLLDALMPESVRVIPIGVLALVFILFVLVVGPVDYFVLGLLRRRRWTWVVFPLLCGGLALVVVNISERYMGLGRRHSSLTFVDVGSGGEVLRSTRFGLSFSGKEGAVRAAIEDGLFSPVNIALLRYGSYYYYPGQLPADSSSRTVLYEGRFPSRYSVTYRVPQWTPVMERVTTFGSDVQPPELDWDDLGEASDRSFVAWYSLGREWLAKLDGPGAVYLLRGGGSIHTLAENWRGDDGAGWRRPELSGFLRDVTMRQPAGLFAVVSQIAPTGSGDFADLSVLDPADPRRQMVMVLTRREDDYICYRRLYRGE